MPLSPCVLVIIIIIIIIVIITVIVIAAINDSSWVFLNTIVSL